LTLLPILVHRFGVTTCATNLLRKAARLAMTIQRRSIDNPTVFLAVERGGEPLGRIVIELFMDVVPKVSLRVDACNSMSSGSRCLWRHRLKTCSAATICTDLRVFSSEVVESYGIFHSSATATCQLYVCPPHGQTAENFRQLCTGEAGIGQQTGLPLTLKGSPFHRIIR
jgi:hypothetical protein